MEIKWKKFWPMRQIWPETGEYLVFYQLEYPESKVPRGVTTPCKPKKKLWLI